MFAGLRPDGSAKVVLSRPSSIAFSFILSTKDAVPPWETRESTRAAALSDGDQRQMQHVVQRDPLIGAQIRGRGRVDVASLDRHFCREVGRIFEKHHCGHDLGDAGNGALVLRVLLPENLAGFGVENDRGGGANIRHLGDR